MYAVRVKGSSVIKHKIVFMHLFNSVFFSVLNGRQRLQNILSATCSVRVERRFLPVRGVGADGAVQNFIGYSNHTYKYCTYTYIHNTRRSYVYKPAHEYTYITLCAFYYHRKYSLSGSLQRLVYLLSTKLESCSITKI